MKKTIWDHLLFIILIVLLILASSCEYEEYEPYIKDEIKDELKLNNYKESWDVIKHYPFETLTYSDFNYYSNCWLDNTALLADFDLDGDNDVMIAPDCTDDDQRQPPIKFFKNDKGKFSEWNINIDNNIGIISGTRTTIVGDYNNDKIPDVFFISHNGHGYGFGVPSILLSNENGFVFKDLDLEKKWYSDGTSGDIDNDGDLDIVLPRWVTMINQGDGTFSIQPFPIETIDDPTTLVIADLDNDGMLEWIYGSGTMYQPPGEYRHRSWIGNPVEGIKDIIPHVDNFGIFLDVKFWDIDNDGVLEMVVNRASDSNHPQGHWIAWHMQVLDYTDDGVIDITNSTIEQNTYYPTTPGLGFGWISSINIREDKYGNVFLFSDDGNTYVKWKLENGFFKRVL